MMAPTATFQDALYKEMLARIKETDVNVPYKKGDYFYYSRTVKGKQYPIQCRKKGSVKAPEEITLDTERDGEGPQVFQSGRLSSQRQTAIFSLSTTDTTGFRQYNLFVKDLRTGKISEKIGRARDLRRLGVMTTRRSSTRRKTT